MCQTDPLAVVRFAVEFASVIPLNDQESGKKATETSPVMFGRRIAKRFVVPVPVPDSGFPDFPYAQYVRVRRLLRPSSDAEPFMSRT